MLSAGGGGGGGITRVWVFIELSVLLKMSSWFLSEGEVIESDGLQLLMEPSGLVGR